MTDQVNLNEKIFGIMQEGDPDGRLTFPPHCTRMVESRFTDYKEGKSLEVEFPLKSDYNNPGGVVLGGYYSVFFDMAIGPLSYLVSHKYAVSLDINVSFLHPPATDSDFITVKAYLKSRSRRLMYFTAEAFDIHGKMLATCNSRMMIIQ
ncbi:MAG: PaaI family thioesterase [Bacteroidetes bacterium]|nr:PaaI family thioesterase [Bacteroidota bacterium]